MEKEHQTRESLASYVGKRVVITMDDGSRHAGRVRSANSRTIRLATLGLLGQNLPVGWRLATQEVKSIQVVPES